MTQSEGQAFSLIYRRGWKKNIAVRLRDLVDAIPTQVHVVVMAIEGFPVPASQNTAHITIWWALHLHRWSPKVSYVHRREKNKKKTLTGTIPVLSHGRRRWWITATLMCVTTSHWSRSMAANEILNSFDLLTSDEKQFVSHFLTTLPSTLAASCVNLTPSLCLEMQSDAWMCRELLPSDTSRPVVTLQLCKIGSRKEIVFGHCFITPVLISQL